MSEYFMPVSLPRAVDMITAAAPKWIGASANLALTAAAALTGASPVVAARFSTMPEYAPAVVSSAVQGPTRSRQANSANLQLHAHLVVAGRRAIGLGPSNAARSSFAKVLSRFVADGGPTPQPAVLASGGLEVQWVVGGRVVMAVIESDGDYNLYGEDETARVLFDIDVDAGAEPDAVSSELISQELESLGRLVTTRVEALA